MVEAADVLWYVRQKGTVSQSCPVAACPSPVSLCHTDAVYSAAGGLRGSTQHAAAGHQRAACSSPLSRAVRSGALMRRPDHCAHMGARHPAAPPMEAIAEAAIHAGGHGCIHRLAPQRCPA